MTTFNIRTLSLVIDTQRHMIIFHRWGENDAGKLERFIVVVNYLEENQKVDIPFPVNGVWTDVLNNNEAFDVNGFRLNDHEISAY